MRDILKLREQMQKRGKIKQEFEMECSKAWSVAVGARDKAYKVLTSAKAMKQQLPLSLAEPFSEVSIDAQGTSFNPKRMAGILGRRAGGFCRGCGFKLLVDNVFCKNCGSKVR